MKGRLIVNENKNRLDARIEKCRDNHEGILVGLIPFGDPDLEVSAHLVDVYLEAGVDIVEFALASEDPFVDSRQIKESGARALAKEPDLLKHFEKIKHIRQAYPQEPFEVMAYSDAKNKVGVQRLVREMQEADIDAHLLADSVFCEKAVIAQLEDLLTAAKIYRIRFMPHPYREHLLEDIGSAGKGFMILQSIADANGMRPRVAPENKGLVERVRASGTKAAIILAYGIRDEERASEAAATGADGIIVGTSFVELISQADYNGLSRQIKAIKNALKR